MTAAPRIAVFPIEAVGHANPMLAVVEALLAVGAEVRGFGAPGLAGCLDACGAAHAETAAGALSTSVGGDMPVPVRMVLRPLPTLDETVRRLGAFDPDLVLHDVFSLAGYVAARALGRRSVGLVTMPGYGAMPDAFASDMSGFETVIDDAYARYRQRFDVDLAVETPVAGLAPGRDLDLITAPRALVAALEPASHPALHARLTGRLPPSTAVGRCAGTVRWTPPAHNGAGAGAVPLETPFPIARWERAGRDGQKRILFSLGTVLTDARFETPVGGAPSGRAFLSRALALLVQIARNRPDWLIAAAVGPRLPDDAVRAFPENLIARRFLPLDRLLAVGAEAWITHHGANSTLEAIEAGVPTVGLPGAGDQIANALKASALGISAVPWPAESCYDQLNKERLANALDSVVGDPAWRSRVDAVAVAMRGGGAGQAADAILDLVGSGCSAARAEAARRCAFGGAMITEGSSTVRRIP